MAQSASQLVARVRVGTRDRLESLPTFWMAYALTVTETVGSGILALPIALALVGPAPAILLLILVGLINVLTVAWIAKAVARTADIRYGGAYLGRMVKEYPGSSGAALLIFALVVNSVVGIIAYAVGLAGTLSTPNGTIAAVWIALLFAGTGWWVARGSVQVSATSAIGIGSVSLGLLLVPVVIALRHVDSGNLRYMEFPGVAGRPWDVSILGPIFGTLRISCFGHTSVGNCASVVLRRDPGGRPLIQGVIAAQATVIAIYTLWIFSINGALSPDMLAGHTGTVLIPLADVAGPSVPIVGAGFVTLAMGLGLMRKADVLINTMRDWSPRRSNPVVVVPRGRGTTAGLGLTRLLDVDTPALAGDSAGVLLRWMLREGSAGLGRIAAWPGRGTHETRALLRKPVAFGTAAILAWRTQQATREQTGKAGQALASLFARSA